MEKAVLKILFGILVFRHATAAPSDVTAGPINEKLEDIAEVTRAETDDKADSSPVTLLEPTSDKTSTQQSPRQKRWFDYYGGFPPFNPNFYNRDNPFIPGGFTQQDPLVQIHSRLVDISNQFRNPPLPTPQLQGFPHFPTFVPVIYIPQVGCGCTPDSNTPRPAQDDKRNTTDPDVMNRWPEMEDDRQNWGIVMNDTDNQENEDDGDGSRPISFDPIGPSRPTMRPPPPVEHGSSQGDINSLTTDRTTTTTFRPAFAPPSSNGGVPLLPPTICDSAILKCCLLPQVTYDCFAVEGCQNPSSYGYPCDNGVISRVIDRFLKYYGQRQG